MKKLTQLVGVFATGLIWAAALGGCSATPDPVGTPMSTAGTGAGGGAGAAGAAGTTGVAGGTQLTGADARTVLAVGEFTAGPTPAPAGWSSGGCVSCHGANGEGNVIGTEIRHTPTAYAKWVVRNGRPLPSAMVAFPPMSADPKALVISEPDLDAVLAWLQQQPKPTTGVALYRDFCGNCHGPKVASGGAVPVNVIGKMKTEVTQKVRFGEGMDPSMRNGFMPPEDVASLTDVELGLIQDYLMSK